MEVKIEHRLTAVEDRAKSNSLRLDDVERRQDNLEELTSTVAVLASEQKTMKTDVKEIKTDVKNLSEKPAKRWDNLVDKILWAVAAALIGYALSKFGL